MTTAWLQRELESGLKEQKVSGSIPASPRAQKVLEFAALEAKAFGHTYVGTEHILLGILREGEGTAARHLEKLGMKLDETRALVLQELGESAQAPSRKEAEPVRAAFLSPEVNQAIVNAKNEADQFARESVDIDLLFLGLLMSEKGAAVEILAKNGLTSAIVRANIEYNQAARVETVVAGQAPLSMPVTWLLNGAAQEFQRTETNPVSVDQLLATLLKQEHRRKGRGPVGAIIRKLGVNLEELYSQVIEAIQSQALPPLRQKLDANELMTAQTFNRMLHHLDKHAPHLVLDFLAAGVKPKEFDPGQK